MGSDSSDEGRGEGSARTPQGGNRRRHVSPDGNDAPASSSNQNLSREDRKLQAIMQSFAKMEERAQRKRNEADDEDKGRTPAAPTGERDDGKNRGTSPIRKRPKGESGMRRRQQQSSVVDSLDDIPPLHAIPHLSTHDRLRISKPAVSLPSRAKSTSLPLKKRLMQEWAEHESNRGSASRQKDSSEMSSHLNSNALGSDSSSDEGGMQVSPGPSSRMETSRDNWRDDWRRDEDRRSSSITSQQQSSRGGRDWGRERSSTILSFEERQKLLSESDSSRMKPVPSQLRVEECASGVDGQLPHGTVGSVNRGGTYSSVMVAPERTPPIVSSNRPPWGPSYGSAVGNIGSYDRSEQPYSGAGISRMWDRPVPGTSAAPSPVAPYPPAASSNLLWNPTLMTFQPRSGFLSGTGATVAVRGSDSRETDAKDHRPSNTTGAGVCVGVTPQKVIPRDSATAGEMGYRFAPPPAATANIYLGKDAHAQQTATMIQPQRLPPPPPQPGRGDADYRREW